MILLRLYPVQIIPRAEEEGITGYSGGGHESWTTAGVVERGVVVEGVGGKDFEFAAGLDHGCLAFE